uniref:IgGFc_binding domain-containing protein n=1 Tax=Parastrongyloides trichosuri TaxID=131310 RepID=A0A0N4ZGL9_PARTI
MTMNYSIFITLLLISIPKIIAATDTIGTEFVLSFANLKLIADYYTIVCTNDNNYTATANIKWWSLLLNMEVEDFLFIEAHGYNEYSFNKYEVLYTSYSGYGEINFVPENRIMINSDLPISVVASFHNRCPNLKNLHLVPSIPSLGQNYMVQLPEPSRDQFQIIQFLPLKNDTLIEITHYVNGIYLSKSTLVLKSKFGSTQHVMVRQQHTSIENSSFLIQATKPIAVVATVTCVKTKFACDYVAYMPQSLPLPENEIPNENSGKIFALTSNTDSVYIYPQGAEYADIFITVSNDNKYDISENISTYYPYEFLSTSTLEYQIVAFNSSLRASRFVSELHEAPLYGSNDGACITNLPPISCFITGKILFALYDSRRFIEVYTDVRNMYNMFINDISIYKFNPKTRVLVTTDFMYAAFEVDLSKLFGTTATLYSDGIYMAYYIDTWGAKLACYELGYNN